jgi:Cys-tRNA(Pro)/Cys-tRNA(Cys) deacylase
MKKTNAMRLLDQQKVPYEVFEYEYDPEHLNVELIAGQNGLPVELVYKTLVAEGDKTGVVVAVVPGHCELDLKALAALSGNKKIALVPVKDIQNLTGYIRGGCSPIGMKKKYPVWIDEAAKSLDFIYVNAGVRGILLKLAPKQLVQVTQGNFGQIAG